MKTIVPFINFDGDCEEAFNFYKEVFGGEFKTLKRYNEISEHKKESNDIDEDDNKIMYISLIVGDTILIGRDTNNLSSFGNRGKGSISLAVKTESREESDTLFKALSVGGEVIEQMDETPMDGYSGSITDKYGITWIICYKSEPGHEIL